LSQVGLILVTDVSRLARNCQDWYHLLDLASVCGTLISDASDIYDPRCYDDRLLLGLKGTFSEAQWYSMRTQLYAAQLNKARRGELVLRLPVGYERLPDRQVVLTADQQVQAAIRLVFDTFDQFGSVWAVLRHWCAQGLQLPRLVQTGPKRGDIEWGARIIKGCTRSSSILAMPARMPMAAIIARACPAMRTESWPGPCRATSGQC
jgi:DNA invertase Pin-like site-specific DNA recombinase